MIKKKSKSLLIPFFIWPILNVAFYIFPKLLILKIKPEMLANPGEIPFLNQSFADWFLIFFVFLFVILLACVQFLYITRLYFIFQ